MKKGLLPKMGVRSLLLFFILSLTTLLLSACPGKLTATPRQTDSPALTEIAEAVISGASQAIYPTGTEARNKPVHIKETEVAKLIRANLNMVPKAEAAYGSGFCPEFKYSLPATNVYPAPTPTLNTSCQSPITSPAAAGNVPQIMGLAWGPCYLNSPYATWSGGESLTLMPPSTTLMVCGGPTTTQTVFQAGDQVHRWFVSPTSRIFNLYNPNGQAVPDLSNPTYYPVTVLVDTFAGSQQYGTTPIPSTCVTLACLQQTLPSYAFSGWKMSLPTSGETGTFTGAAAVNITVDGIHLVGEKAGFIVWDYTISTADPTGVNANVPIAVNAAGNVTAGVVYIQDNRNFIVTQSTVAATLGYTASCGVPSNGGTVNTVTLAGTYPAESLTNFGLGTNNCGANGATLTQAGVPSTTNLIYAF